MTERKPFDPDLQRLLAEQAAAAGRPVQMTDEERVRLRRAFMIRALKSRATIPGLPNSVATRDVVIDGPLTARLYIPPGAAELLPVLVYFHGGGWVAGSVATHDPFCRLLSEASGVIIASVEYRLAPENPYPAAVEDSLCAMRWATEHAAEWRGNPAAIALGGDSAGANLAAVVATRLSGTGEAHGLRALLLLYPVTDYPGDGHASYKENATGYGLEASLMQWFWDLYAPGISPDDPDVSPLRSPQTPPLPSTLIATAEYDPLRDEGVAYLKKLRAEGIAVTHLHSPDMHHNFPVHPATVARFPQCDAALAEIARWLCTALGNTQTSE